MEDRYKEARNAHMERMQLLLNVAARARKGETIVLIYPRRFMLRNDAAEYEPMDATLNMTAIYWAFPSGGRVFFRDVSIEHRRLQGLMAEFVWVGNARSVASSELRDLIEYRNSIYKHRTNSRYPIDESDC